MGRGTEREQGEEERQDAWAHGGAVWDCPTTSMSRPRGRAKRPVGHAGGWVYDCGLPVAQSRLASGTAGMFRAMRFLPFIFKFLRGPACVALLLLGAGSGRAVDSRASIPAVEIGVRSSVDERWEGVHKRGAITHGKVYLIASLKESPSARKLVRAVDEAGLLAQLRRELNAQGFRESTAAEAPEVVLTLLYGRGHVRNPYLANIDGDEFSGSLAPTPMESALAAAVDPRLYDKRGWGFYEQKLLAAQKEKLFIRVTAWKFPGDRKEKPAALWKTTMVVDEPEQRDLNELYPQMLAAGVRYFDRVIKQEEGTVPASVPAGRVILGPLIILPPAEPASDAGPKTQDEPAH